MDSASGIEPTLYGRIVNVLKESVKWHTSPIDWCEPNYAVTPHVVEFYNATTNTLFVILPPILMILFHPFSRTISRRIHLIWIMMACVGMSSAYFHGTLTLSGQLMDEYGIIWLFCACVAFWFPKQYVPKVLFKSRNRFEVLMLTIAITLTVLGVLKPILNSFLMMCFTVPMIITTVKEIQNSEERTVKLVGIQTGLFWILAVIIWLVDRFACDVYLRAGLPGGHWIWHIVSGICCYRFIVLLLYKDTQRLHGETKPELVCWPNTPLAPLVGILYIRLNSPLPTHSQPAGAGRAQLQSNTAASGRGKKRI